MPGLAWPACSGRLAGLPAWPGSLATWLAWLAFLLFCCASLRLLNKLIGNTSGLRAPAQKKFCFRVFKAVSQQLKFLLPGLASLALLACSSRLAGLAAWPGSLAAWLPWLPGCLPRCQAWFPGCLAGTPGVVAALPGWLSSLAAWLTWSPGCLAGLVAWWPEYLAGLIVLKEILFSSFQTCSVTIKISFARPGVAGLQRPAGWPACLAW